MSRNYKKFLRNSGLVLSQPETRSSSHQKDIISLLHQKENINLSLLSEPSPSGSATEETSSINGSPCGSRQGTMKKQAARMMSQIESDSSLMENDPLSEKLRVETLREMPQSLSLKRTVKAKLTRAVSIKSKTHPIGCCQSFKYWISISLTRFRLHLNEILSGTELWYSSLKTIEGHFGSDVAAFFKFIRWLFILDLFVFVLSFSFVVAPQMVKTEMTETNGTSGLGDVITSMPDIVTSSISNSSLFHISDIFTGEIKLLEQERYE